MSRYYKFIVALAAAAGVIASSGVLDDTAELLVNTIVAAVGAGLVYLVPNAPRLPTAPPTKPSNEPPT